jgi:polysaccharide biosynthesis protein PslG
MSTQIYYPEGQMINGVNWHAAWAFQRDAAVRKGILDDMAGAGLTSVRLDFAWNALEGTKGQYTWGSMDTFVNEAAAHNMTVLVMLYWPPAWASSTGSAAKNAPPKNGADFGNICGQVGKRYGSKLAGVEMWNEPDITTFWSGSRQQFFQMIHDAYPVAKNLSPSTTYVAGAPTYIGLASNWFKDAYASGIYKGYYDAQGIHPYMSPSDLPPDAPKSNWSVKGIADLQALRSSNGDTSPLWATEWGWSTHTQPADTPNYWRGVSEALQADYTVAQMKMLPGFGVTHSYLYTECDMSQTAATAGPGIHERNFGIQRIDYTDKPAVGAIKAYLKPVVPPVTEPPVVEPPKDSSLEEVQARIVDLETKVDALLADVADNNVAIDALEAQTKLLMDRFDILSKGMADRLQALAIALESASDALQ